MTVFYIAKTVDIMNPKGAVTVGSPRGTIVSLKGLREVQEYIYCPYTIENEETM